jgi:hypothetical protein
MASHMAGAALTSVKKTMHWQQQLRALCDQLEHSIASAAEATDCGIDSLVAAASDGSSIEHAAERMRLVLRDGEY